MPAFNVLSYGALGNPVTVPDATLTSPVVPTLYKNVHGFSVEIAVPQVALWQMNGAVDVWEATPPGTPPALFFGKVISLAPGQNGAGTIMVFSASAPPPLRRSSPWGRPSPSAATTGRRSRTRSTTRNRTPPTSTSPMGATSSWGESGPVRRPARALSGAGDPAPALIPDGDAQAKRASRW